MTIICLLLNVTVVTTQLRFLKTFNWNEEQHQRGRQQSQNHVSKLRSSHSFFLIFISFRLFFFLRFQTRLCIANVYGNILPIDTCDRLLIKINYEVKALLSYPNFLADEMIFLETFDYSINIT